jgi:hypothetical protein
MARELDETLTALRMKQVSLELLLQRERLAKKVRDGWLVALGLVSVAIATFSNTPADISSLLRTGPWAPKITQEPALKADIELLQREVRNVDQRLTALASVPQKPLQPDAVTQQVTTLQSTVDSTGKRLEKIEQVILADPAKALEMNLLRRDIQNLQAVQQATMEAVKKDVDRLDLWAKAIFGLIFAFSMAPGLERIVRARKQPDPNSTDAST